MCGSKISKFKVLFALDINTKSIQLIFLSFFLSFFFRRLTSELAKRNSTKIGHMFRSKCNLRTHVQNLVCPPTNWGPKNHLFGRLRNYGNFNGLYLRNETWNRQLGKSLQLQGVSCIVWKQRELWSINGFKLDGHFNPPSVNSAFYFIVRLCRRRSTNGTQPHFAKRWTVNRANNLP